MAWEELSIEIPRERLDGLSDALFALGCSGLQEDDGALPRQIWESGEPAAAPQHLTVRAWFENPDRGRIEEGLRGAIGEAALVWAASPDVDWEAESRARFAPIVVSERLTIAAPWDAPAGALIIEPGQGFGTGDHPTTRAMLVALESLASESRRVLDVGCGSGILALAARKLGLAARGVDTDPAAVAEARSNAALNELQVTFDTTPVAELEPGADLVLANLHAEVLVLLAPELVRLTSRRLVLCGILREKESTVRSAFASLTLEARDLFEGRWVRLRYRQD